MPSRLWARGTAKGTIHRVASNRPRRRALASRWSALGLVLSLVTLSSPSRAITTREARSEAEESVRGVERQIGQVSRSIRAQRKEPSVAERIAAGDISLRNKDYERAIDELNQVLELHRQGKIRGEAPRADALFLLGEAYLQNQQYLSARRQYRALLDSAERSPYDSYAGRAISRLVDIALRVDDLASLDDVVARLARLPTSDASGSLQYARGKALFARGNYDAARASLGSVQAGSDYHHQAEYLLAVILTKQSTPTEATTPPENPEAPPAQAAPAPARYAAAIEQFRRVTRLPADTTAHRHVIDLAWMAIGRLFYETDNFLDAAEAYSHVDRASPEFSNMLYELAWVYVRMGDYQRAQRALEVLSITDPEGLRLADGSLLRADLMLRSGQFDKALTLYESVHRRFDPIREQVATFLQTTTDPAVYYDKLVEDRLEPARKSDELSPIVIEWAREEAEQTRAFAVIDDVTRSRDLVRRSRRLVQKLNGVLSSRARVKAFPELQGALERTLGLLNRVETARRTLAAGMDDVAESADGELGRVRQERRSLMRRMGYLPVNDGDFARREAEGERQWNKLSQQLQALTVQIDKLQAITNGLKRVLRDSTSFTVTQDPMSLQRFQQEITANERELKAHEARIRELSAAVEVGRSQIGFGDQRYVEDDQVRSRFRQVFAREVQLVSAGGDDADAVRYARAITPLLQRMDVLAAQLEGGKDGLERDAFQRAEETRRQVQNESAYIERYAENLEELDHQARLLVGEVAMQNFALVRDKLKSIVLRADVGIVQHAWEVREEQRTRVNTLQRERAREEQNLNDELREVLDDAEDEL